MLDAVDSSGALSASFREWIEEADAELRLIRGWRSRVPRFASARHDAAALAAFLMWKNPVAHEVHTPLAREYCDALIGMAGSGEHESSVHEVESALAEHATTSHVQELIGMLERWYECGDGCVVVATWPPRLSGVMPKHVSDIWDPARVDRLIEYELLVPPERRRRCA